MPWMVLTEVARADGFASRVISRVDKHRTEFCALQAEQNLLGNSQTVVLGAAVEAHACI